MPHGVYTPNSVSGLGLKSSHGWLLPVYVGCPGYVRNSTQSILGLVWTIALWVAVRFRLTVSRMSIIHMGSGIGLLTLKVWRVSGNVPVINRLIRSPRWLIM